MNISDAGLNIIKKYEGCRLTAYRCPSGVLTIGYGHTNGVREGQTITETQATEYLKNDVHNAEKYVSAYIPIYHFSQLQFDALTSFCFNCGPGNLRKLLNGGQHVIHEISEGFPNYCHSKGKVLNGLVRRRAEEKALFDRGTSKKPIPDVAEEVIAGKWGNNPYRQKALEQAGYDYEEVRKEDKKFALEAMRKGFPSSY